MDKQPLFDVSGTIRRRAVLYGVVVSIAIVGAFVLMFWMCAVDGEPDWEAIRRHGADIELDVPIKLYHDTIDCAVISVDCESGDTEVFALIGAIRRPIAVSVSNGRLTTRDAEAIGKAPRLYSLAIGQSKVDSGALERLSAAVRDLAVINCDIANTNWNRVFAHLRQLEYMSVEESTVGDDLLYGIVECKGLRRLDLKGTQVSDEGLCFLARGTRKLLSLNVEACDVTDRGAKCVSEIPTLQMANVSKTAVTDRGVSLLLSCPEIMVMSANDVKLSAESIPALEAARRLQLFEARRSGLTRAIIDHARIRATVIVE